MSRNLRQKSIATPTKTTARRSSKTTNDSSDDDYAGVDGISDSEDEETDVEAVEEMAIIESANEDDDLQATPRPSIDDDQSSWDGFPLESEEGVLGQNTPFFDEHMARMHPTHDGESSHNSDDDVSPTRRVRFASPEDSDTAQSDSEDSLYPDIFVDQNSLDPSFRRMIENGDDNDDGQASSEDGSYWDFRDSPEIANVPEGSDEGEESDSSTGSSGYETDEGETTEEDLPPAAKYVPARSVLRRDSTASSSEEEVIPRRPSIRRGPKLGSWIHDASKPFAVLDSRGKKLLMFKAKIRRRFSFNGNGSRPELGQAIDDIPQSFIQDMSPMISNSANLMMSAMYTDDFFNGPALGPPEAFYAFTSVDADGTITQPDSHSDEYDEDDVDDEDLWQNFIQIEEESSGDENGEEVDPSSDSPTGVEPSSTPARPTTATSEDRVHPLLNHFNSGVVGAFRRNQNRHQLLSRNTESRESLAFSGPYRNGTIRGIKGGRLEAANTPITPLRKRKSTRRTIPMDSSPLSHLTGGGMEDKKRKFEYHESLRGNHKRSKSMN